MTHKRKKIISIAVTPIQSMYVSDVIPVVWKQLMKTTLEAAYTSVLQMVIVKYTNDIDNNIRRKGSNIVFLTLPDWAGTEYRWALQTLRKVLNKFRGINMMVFILIPGEDISTIHDILLTKKRHRTKNGIQEEG